MSASEQNREAGASAKVMSARMRGRVRWLALVISVFALGLAAYGIHWFLAARYAESTDDAYVQAAQVSISSNVSSPSCSRIVSPSS